MSQIKQVNLVLKQLLRQHQITYKEIARNLNMSEANIKRIFSTQSFTLARLEQICDMLKMNLSDLFALAQKQVQQISQLTVEQEQELLADPKLLLIAVCVRDAWKFDEIIDYYDIDKLACIQLLAKLDKLKIIELLPNNHFRSLIAQDFRWIPGGPLERFMEQEVMVKFMAPKQNEQWNFRFYLRGRYSQSSIDIIQRKLNQLTKEAAVLNQEDADLPLDKRQHIGLLMAMRPWEPSLFENMRRL
ncbi:helix-turn-helix transcriptional regulator [Paraglaciecola aquimarina]|uniref:Helix-turn-helix transcriptional regulator n=1 Tax=Paraglaciecola algarum TaxID=3050085 RepID=A0ABS9D962_9ALTE|nr:helix-turn-helix transcriptional regulator [Paraglaciecola sp. G1-23]MCF2948915.1 helix-turn-helix transcriptional regulator [Paraglaciecola sp. G1-23]